MTTKKPEPYELTEDEVETFFNEALRKFIMWANQYETDKKLHLKFTDFLSEYGMTEFDAHPADLWNNQIIIQATVGTGDEGGPSFLTICIHNQGYPDPEWKMKWLVHEFDTMADMIWDDEEGLHKA